MDHGKARIGLWLVVTSVFAGGAAAQAQFPAGVSPYRPPAKVAKTGIGFRGDGSGVFPNDKPPTTWDEKTGKNILWKTPMLNWGLACPVPVGNRVLVMDEPDWNKVNFPRLTCYDADTGKRLWSKEVNPFDAFPDLDAPRRKTLTADVAFVHQLWYQGYRIQGEFIMTGGQSKDSNSPGLAKVQTELKQQGFKELVNPERWILGKRIGDYGAALSDDTKKRKEEAEKRLRAYGVAADAGTDNCGLARTGACFATPVSDGQSVYVTTVHGTVACYDMEGNLRWMRWSGWKLPGHAWFIASPRLWGDILLTPFGSTGQGQNMLYAWDKATGKKLWELKSGPPQHAYNGMSLAILEAPSAKDPKAPRTPVVISPQGVIARLPDGKVFTATADIPYVRSSWGIDFENAIVFMDYPDNEGTKGMTSVAQMLRMDGEALVLTDRYRIRDRKVEGARAFLDGRVYCSDYQLDAATGWVVGAKDEKLPVKKKRDSGYNSPRTKHLILVAGGHVYGVDQVLRTQEGKQELAPRIQDGVCEVFTLDGKKVAANVMVPAPWQGEKTTQMITQGFFQDYYWFTCRGNFSISCPMNIGADRLYIRSNDYLYCIGER